MLGASENSCHSKGWTAGDFPGSDIYAIELAGTIVSTTQEAEVEVGRSLPKSTLTTTSKQKGIHPTESIAPGS